MYRITALNTNIISIMEVKVCTGKMCSERWSEYILKRLENDKKTFNLEKLDIQPSLCMGGCKQGPNVVIGNEKFNKMNPLKTSDLLFKKLKENKNANK